MIARITYAMLSLAAAMLLGTLAFCVPVWVLHERTPYLVEHFSLFPILETGASEMSWLTLAILLCGGTILGWFGRGQGWLLGLATVTPVLGAIQIDLIAFPTSHNLWPIEYLGYLAIGLATTAAVYLGRLIRAFVQRTAKERCSTSATNARRAANGSANGA